jgi:hypothetical protein
VGPKRTWNYCGRGSAKRHFANYSTKRVRH